MITQFGQNIKSTTVDHEAGTIAFVFKAYPKATVTATPKSYPETPGGDGLFHASLVVTGEDSPLQVNQVRGLLNRKKFEVGNFLLDVAKATFKERVYT